MPKRFFNSQFNRQAMGIPAAFTFNLVAFQGFITAKNIFNRAPHNVVNTGHTISAWRAFVKGIRLGCRPAADAFFKYAVLLSRNPARLSLFAIDLTAYIPCTSICSPRIFKGCKNTEFYLKQRKNAKRHKALQTQKPFI
jgi:hypothetical protein